MFARRLHPSFLFYGGGLASSVGSMTLTVSVVAFLAREGRSFALIGLTICLMRLLPASIALISEKWVGRVSPIRALVTCELAGFVFDFMALAAWKQRHTDLRLFVVVLVLRAIVLAIPQGARAKVTKILSSPDYAGHLTQAVWYNRASQGAALFSGLLGYLAIRFASLESVLLFDAATFVFNAVALLVLGTVLLGSQNRTVATTAHFWGSMTLLYERCKSVATLDLLLAVVMCGLGTLNSRLAGKNQEITAVLLASYGAAVWLSGSLVKKIDVTRLGVALWFTMGTVFVLIGYATNPAMTVLLSFCKDLIYWLLFHTYTAKINHAFSQSELSGVTIARMFQMVVVLSLGEWTVGLFAASMPVFGECLWRAGLASSIGLGLYLIPRMKAVTASKVARP